MSNPLVGHTIRHRWTEGAFAGGTFENTYHDDSSMTYRAVEGSYAGATGTFPQYSAREAAPGVWLMSWLEDSGYTVTILFTFATHSVLGVVSNNQEWYPLSGTFEEVA